MRAPGHTSGCALLSLLLGIAASLIQTRDLDLLQLGEETAASFGVEVESSKRMLALTAAILVGAAVAVAGTRWLRGTVGSARSAAHSWPFKSRTAAGQRIGGRRILSPVRSAGADNSPSHGNSPGHRDRSLRRPAFYLFAASPISWGGELMSALEARQAIVRRGGQTILGPASIEIGSGEMTALIGPNGSGKSTLLRLFAGLWQAR